MTTNPLKCKIEMRAGRWFVTTLNGGGVHCPASLPEGFATAQECRNWLVANFDWQEQR